MKTIGRHVPRKNRGEYTALCDTCDARYYRSQLRRGPDGLLRCFGPGTNNDAAGRTALELDELNASNTYYDYAGDGVTEGRFDSGEEQDPT